MVVKSQKGDPNTTSNSTNVRPIGVGAQPASAPRTFKVHGGYAYQKGCRCDVCIDAKKLQNQQRYTRLKYFDDNTKPLPFKAGRRCLCGKPLSRYNPGPYCFACDYAAIPDGLKDLWDSAVEADLIRANIPQ